MNLILYYLKGLPRQKNFNTPKTREIVTKTRLLAKHFSRNFFCQHIHTQKKQKRNRRSRSQKNKDPFRSTLTRFLQKQSEIRKHCWIGRYTLHTIQQRAIM